MRQPAATTSFRQRRQVAAAAAGFPPAAPHILICQLVRRPVCASIADSSLYGSSTQLLDVPTRVALCCKLQEAAFGCRGLTTPTVERIGLPLDRSCTVCALPQTTSGGAAPATTALRHVGPHYAAQRPGGRHWRHKLSVSGLAAGSALPAQQDGGGAGARWPAAAAAAGACTKAASLAYDTVVVFNPRNRPSDCQTSNPDVVRLLLLRPPPALAPPPPRACLQFYATKDYPLFTDALSALLELEELRWVWGRGGWKGGWAASEQSPCSTCPPAHLPCSLPPVSVGVRAGAAASPQPRRLPARGRSRRTSAAR